MNAHFQKLLGECSMSAMDAIIEEQCMPVAAEGSPDRATLQQIYESNDLDQRHMLCAQYLGYTELAAQLAFWIAKKAARARAV